jgi:hypothetical protein
MVFTLGYLVTLCLVIPMGLVNLDDNVSVQMGNLGLLFLVMILIEIKDHFRLRFLSDCSGLFLGFSMGWTRQELHGFPLIRWGMGEHLGPSFSI